MTRVNTTAERIGRRIPHILVIFSLVAGMPLTQGCGGFAGRALGVLDGGGVGGFDAGILGGGAIGQPLAGLVDFGGEGGGPGENTVAAGGVDGDPAPVTSVLPITDNDTSGHRLDNGPTSFNESSAPPIEPIS